MLSQKTIDVVKSTVPVLEVHGEAITRRFYQDMFTAHPELLNIFNHANQRRGKQQAALAATVYAAAAHIDNLPAILPVVKQIAHKHRSLGIKPEHYPIVGKHLLGAIKEVLGDAATDEIIGSWGEAYGAIADVFISVEAGMYQEAAAGPGGWVDFKPFTVQKKVKESDVITSFYLVPSDGAPLPGYKAGQYISIKAQIPGQENTHIRQYSLSDAAGKGYYRLSIKREDRAEKKEQGVVSNYMHGSVSQGDQVMLSAPGGDFIMDEKNRHLPVVLLSGGVGLTPLTSMLHEVVETQPGRPVTFIHAAMNGSQHALRDEIESIAARHPHVKAQYVYQCPTDDDKSRACFHKEGFVDLDFLKSVVDSPKADFYFCGPLPFMKAIYRALTQWGVPSGQMHYEVFGPAENLTKPD